MKNRVEYKKEPKMEVCHQDVITTWLVTCNLPRVQSSMSLITQIQWECSVQVKVYSQRRNRSQNSTHTQPELGGKIWSVPVKSGCAGTRTTDFYEMGSQPVSNQAESVCNGVVPFYAGGGNAYRVQIARLDLCDSDICTNLNWVKVDSCLSWHEGMLYRVTIAWMSSCN